VGSEMCIRDRLYIEKRAIDSDIISTAINNSFQ
jgi:hypothetical protein